MIISSGVEKNLLTDMKLTRLSVKDHSVRYVFQAGFSFGLVASYLGVDYMRGTGSVLTHLVFQKQASSENIFLTTRQKNVPVQVSERKIDLK